MRIIKQTINNSCYVLIHTKEEHEAVQKICFKHNVYWAGDVNRILPKYIRGRVNYIHIHMNMFGVLWLLTACESNFKLYYEKDQYNYKEFNAKYGC